MWIDAASGAITTHYELVYQLDIEPVLGLFDTGVLPSMVGERYVCDQWSKVVVVGVVVVWWITRSLARGKEVRSKQDVISMAWQYRGDIGVGNVDEPMGGNSNRWTG